MPEITIPLPRPHTGQRDYLKGARRFNVLCCGRRWGKNIVSHRRIIKAALPGKPCAWFAPTYRMLAEDWRELYARLAPVVSRKNESEHRLDLIGGGYIEMWSLDNPDSARGRKYAHAVINEAAMVKDLTYAWTTVIRPTLADMRGGADFPSTPKGLNGYFELWKQAGEDPDWARFHYRTNDNPFIHPDEIAAMRGSLPAHVIQQEIDAEFVEDGAYFQNVDAAAVIDQPDTPAQHKGHYTVMGVDWAMSNDWTVLTVACRDCNRVVDWQRFNQLDFTYQREKLVEMAKRWGVGGVLPERNSIGEPNIELLIDRVPVLTGPDGKLGWNTSATTKPVLIQGLAAALEHHGFQVPREYGDELRSYEVETMASGHPKFSAPDGQHDDRVISLALAWQGIASGGSFILFGA